MPDGRRGHGGDADIVGIGQPRSSGASRVIAKSSCKAAVKATQCIVRASAPSRLVAVLQTECAGLVCHSL